MYHALIIGTPWPASYDFAAEKLYGLPQPGTLERFNQLYKEKSPDYFIVTDLGEYNGQPELKDLLESHFRVIASTEHYLIFDIRNYNPG